MQKEELVNKYRICPKEKVVVIPLGFDLQKFYTKPRQKRADFRNKYQLKDDEIAIGIVGRLTEIKNHQLFLKALKSALTKTAKKVRAFIIGDGEEKEKLIKACKDLKLSYSTIPYQDYDQNAAQKKIHFTSWVRAMDIPYAGLDIIALSSNNEGTPVSLIEAQAASKPIVATEVGGVADIVERNKTALLSNAEDVNAFSHNLLQLINDDKLRQKLGKSSKDFVSKRFHYQRLVDDMQQLYESILS